VHRLSPVRCGLPPLGIPPVGKVLASTMVKLISLGACLVAALSGPSQSIGDMARSAPEISAETWLNTDSKHEIDLRGKVTLLEFWTLGCYNCRNVEPHVKEWQRKFSGQGLVVVGVHSPETLAERDVATVERYVREHGISYPVAIDADFATWRRYGNSAWPAIYLIDRRGKIRFVQVGEGRYAETEQEIETLLSEQ
jgi:thiol-disulfide isomerase/thioredoxin